MDETLPTASIFRKKEERKPSDLLIRLDVSAEGRHLTPPFSACLSVCTRTQLHYLLLSCIREHLPMPTSPLF
jgi:hypothetical protein